MNPARCNRYIQLIGLISNRKQMAKKKEPENSSGVDKGLVAMFLKMTPEDRLQANDNAVRTILELRNAYQKQEGNRARPKRTP